MTARRTTAAGLGIERVETDHKTTMLVPVGGLKNVRDRIQKISLPRVRFAEDTKDPAAGPRRPRKNPA